MKNDILQNRKFVLIFIVSAIILIYIIRLFTFQIIESKYKIGADSNAFLQKVHYAPRGLIYDRNGKLLVFNEPAYDITVIMREVDKLDTLSFCQDINIKKEYFIERMAEIKDRRKNLGYSPYTPQLFITQLNTEEIAIIQQSLYKYHGFYIQNRTLRNYSHPYAAQVLGSIGEVSPEMIKEDNFYRQGDYAGRDGLEYIYEKELRGEKGVEVLLRDAKGRIKGKYNEGKSDIPAKIGKDITLTLDIDLQALGEKLMNGKIGSIVAIEPSTGEILALVSNPTFDPAMLVGRKRSGNYNILSTDPTKPLFNRATQATYSPGSTFKPLQALVALELGGIDKNTQFACNGTESLPIRCTHWHGSPVSLLNAIEQSCNPYFYHAFKATLEKDGYGEKNIYFKQSFDAWRNLMLDLNFGKRFEDSDLYEQSRGNIPTENFYNRYFGETGWRSLTIRSLSIGQGEILVTPLQLANSMAVIANKGYYITPHLNKADSMQRRVHHVNIDEEHFEIVNEGMWRVYEYGTARHRKIPGVVMCGKTGTVQNPHGKDHSLFVGFAPRENPQIAIAVVVENAGFGATWALPIASLMIEQYLNEKVERKDLQDYLQNSILNKDVKKY